jgi:hypothetical protein
MKHGVAKSLTRSVGGLQHVPDDQLSDYLEWLVLCYVGEPGGYGAGYARKVFYSNVAAPLVKEILKQANRPLAEELTNLRQSARIKSALYDENVSRRFETLVDEAE